MQGVRKSGPKTGKSMQVGGKDAFIWISRKRSAAIFKSCCNIGSSLLFSGISSQIDNLKGCPINSVFWLSLNHMNLVLSIRLGMPILQQLCVVCFGCVVLVSC